MCAPEGSFLVVETFESPFSRAYLASLSPFFFVKLFSVFAGLFSVFFVVKGFFLVLNKF